MKSPKQRGHAARGGSLRPLDVLVNVVGGFRWETLEHETVQTWDLMYRLNVRTTVIACKAALPHLLASAHNPADISGRIIDIGAAATAKSAVRGRPTRQRSLAPRSPSSGIHEIRFIS